jgi:hypothetical protein
MRYSIALIWHLRRFPVRTRAWAAWLLRMPPLSPAWMDDARRRGTI